jgi:hypothetical protein
VILRFFEFCDRRKLIWIGSVQLELAALTFDGRSLAAGIDPQFWIGTFPQDRTELSHRQHGAARCVHIQAFDLQTHTHFHVGSTKRGTIFIHIQLDIGQNFLRATSWCEKCSGLKCT